MKTLAILLASIFYTGSSFAELSENQKLVINCDSVTYEAYYVEYDNGVIHLKEKRSRGQYVTTKVIEGENCSISAQIKLSLDQ